MLNSYVLHMNKLEGEYKNKFEQVDEYCTILLEDIDSNTREEIMSSILDTFISAQNDGIEIEKITGNDISKFCEEACSELPIKYRLKHIFEVMKWWSWILLVESIIQILMNISETNFFDIKTQIGSFIASIVICIIMVEVFLSFKKVKIKSDIKNNKISKLTKWASYIAFAICIIVPAVIGNLVQFLIPNWIVLFTSLAIIISYEICFRKENKERKKEQSTNAGFADLVIEEAINQTKRKFHKINERNIKKNRPEITEKDFLEKQVKKAKKALKIAKVYLFFPITCTTVTTIPIILEGETTIFDIIIFFLVTLTVESLIFIPLSKLLSKQNKKLLEKYTEFEEKNISIDEWK